MRLRWSNTATLNLRNDKVFRLVKVKVKMVNGGNENIHWAKLVKLKLVRNELRIGRLLIGFHQVKVKMSNHCNLILTLTMIHPNLMSLTD